MLGAATYALCITMIKLSIALFLLNLTPHRRYIWTAQILIVIIIMTGATYFLLLIFECRPIRFYWARYTGEAGGKCISSTSKANYLYGLSGLDAATDLAMAILPAFIIWGLDMPKQQKIVAIILLSFGATFI